MEHSEIERENFVELYVRGKMPLQERRLFEEHFLDCQQCLDQLEIARGLRQALKISGAPSTVSPVAVPSRRWTIWKWGFAGATACLIIATLTAVTLLRQLQRARGELASAQSEFERQSQDARQELEREPPVIYTLTVSRGIGEEKEIALPRDSRWIVLSIELDTTQFPSYRATLTDNTGKEAWRSESVQPVSPDTLPVSVPSRVLAPGTYTLVIEAAGINGRLPLARFPVRLIPPK